VKPVSRGPANAAEALSSTEGKRVGRTARKGLLEVRKNRGRTRSDFLADPLRRRTSGGAQRSRLKESAKRPL